MYVEVSKHVGVEITILQTGGEVKADSEESGHEIFQDRRLISKTGSARRPR